MSGRKISRAFTIHYHFTNHKPLGQTRRTFHTAMRNSRRNKSYPSVNTWNYVIPGEFRTDSSCREIPKALLEIEGYCMLNIGYSGSKDRYCFELKSDGTFKRKKNTEYDPKTQPDPYPSGCPRSIKSSCIPCKHFSWCESDPDFWEKDRPLHSTPKLRAEYH